MAYVHLGRYAKPRGGEGPTKVELFSDTEIAHGAVWNLRTGAKSARSLGMYYSGDGRCVTYGATANELVHPDGRVVPIGPVMALDELAFVGPYLVIGAQYGKPFAVLDGEGRELGRLAHKSDNPGVFNPRDGKTLWLNEAKVITQHDIATRKVLRTIAAAKGTDFKGLAVSRAGHVASWERGKSKETLVVFDAAGKRVAESAQQGMSIAPLGDGFVISADEAKEFLVVDTALNVRERIPMFEPGNRAFNFVMAMPSGREWIAIGGSGEWDHYGEPGLGPKRGGAPAAKPAVKTKAAAAKAKPSATPKAKPKTKSPAVKPAKKSAAKKR